MSRMMVCALLLLLAPGSFGAYITDKLLAGFYAAPDLTTKPLRALPNDTPMEILEEAGNLSRVRLGDNSEGWVETRFITQEKPARMILLELQAKYASLKRQVENSSGGQQNETPALSPVIPDSKPSEKPLPVSGQHSAAPQQHAEQAAPAEGDENETQRLRRENALLKARIEQFRVPLPGETAIQPQQNALQPWLLPLIMLVMLLGFIAGIAFKNYRLAGQARQGGRSG